MNRLPMVREGKAFRMADLIVYGVLALLIVTLFLVVFLPGEKESEGFRITLRGETVYAYTFGEGEILRGEGVEVTQTGERLLVRVGTDEEYNVVEIDLEKETARMREANCSARRDCTHMRAIEGEGAILCVPHRVAVEALTQDLYRLTL